MWSNASSLRLSTDDAEKGVTVKQGSRLIIVDNDGALVSEFQLTDRDLEDPVAFFSAIRQSIENIEEKEIQRSAWWTPLSSELEYTSPSYRPALSQEFQPK